MTKLFAILPALVWTGSAFAAPRPEPDLGPLGPSVLRAVAAGAWRLQVTTAGGDDNRLLWAVWDDDTTNQWIVRLILLRQQGETVVPVTALRREDAYNPTIETIPSWHFGDRSVLLLRYQIGAAAMGAKLYGIGAKDMLTSLGRIEGSLIELLQIGGAATLRMYATADLKDAPTCFGWEARSHALAHRSCEARQKS